MKNNSLSLFDLEMSYFQPILPLKDFIGKDGHSLYKSLPFWRRNKLLPFFAEGGWGLEVSLSQLIWLRILDHLRALGYPVRDTEKITDYFFKDAYYDDLPAKNLLQQKEVLIKKQSKIKLDEFEQQTLENIESVLGDKLLLYGLKFDISYLSNLVVWCVKMGKEAGILIYPGGLVVEKRGEEFINHSKAAFDVEAPHIYISVKGLLKEFVDNKELSNIVIPYLLEDEERLVLKELRKKNIKEIRILIQSEKIMRVDTQVQQTFTDEQAEQVKKILHLKNYEEVTISTRDNRTITFNRTTKNMTSGKTGSKD
jgi:DNA-binding transcriptional MerR regulator